MDWQSQEVNDGDLTARLLILLFVRATKRRFIASSRHQRHIPSPRCSVFRRRVVPVGTLIKTWPFLPTQYKSFTHHFKRTIMLATLCGMCTCLIYFSYNNRFFKEIYIHYTRHLESVPRILSLIYLHTSSLCLHCNRCAHNCDSST